MALPEVLSERLFTTTDQIEFATLSGDWNPMHMDAVAARRTQAGSPVVHGMHAVMWALDVYIQRFGPAPSPLFLNVRFDRFIYLDHSVEVRIAERGPDSFLIVLSVNGAKVASIMGDARMEPPVDHFGTFATPPSSPVIEARNLDLPDLIGSEGRFADSATPQSLSAAFPALAGAFGAGAVGSLVALSTLVGMYAPGLHSIFSKFAIILGAAAEPRGLSYRVTRAQPLLRAVEIAVDGPGLAGSVSCFVRQPPVSQPSALSLKGFGVPDCTGHRVLIVGGSRGLGEITAKLCALGGADVTVTYAIGALEAEAVRDDIVANGGCCEVRRLDVTEPVDLQLEVSDNSFTHMYYFATSQIFRQKTQVVSPKILSKFLDLHLYGFNALCELVAASGNPVKVFYPSSVAIDEKPKDAVEYVIAKMAGETLSGALSALVPGLTVLVERLPRTATDQTATVLPVKSATAADVMLPIIRRMHANPDIQARGQKA